MARIVVALRPHHHHAFVLVPGLEHPLAFVDENRERLLDVDVLAGRAGHDGEHGMPMVGGGHHHAIDIFVFVHPAKIAVAFGIRAFQVRQAFIQARLVDVAHRHAVDVRERPLEIRDVLLADQSEPDEADSGMIVGPQDPAVRCRR
jgi:hypothetical protein